MSSKSKIEWTQASWNPLVGCTKVSEGCRNCYAIRFSHRMSTTVPSYFGITKKINGKPEWSDKIRVDRNKLRQPLTWKRARMIFVNSMSDMFHERVDDLNIAEIFAIMATESRHTFQILTKRPQRMATLLTDEPFKKSVETLLHNWGYSLKLDNVWPLRNVWVGASVENGKSAIERVPYLLMTPAAIRWISAEPLLGRITNCSLGVKLRGIQWIVAGGETGPNARPAHPDWFRALRDLCVSSGVPFFFKQWGEWGTVENLNVYKNSQLAIVDPATGDFFLRNKNYNLLMPVEKSRYMIRAGRKAAGRLLDGKEWNEYPNLS